MTKSSETGTSKGSLRLWGPNAPQLAGQLSMQAIDFGTTKVLLCGVASIQDQLECPRGDCVNQGQLEKQDKI